MVYYFAANGSEESEIVVPIDLLRRAGHEVTLVSIQDKIIKCAHGMNLVCDKLFDECDFRDGQMFVLPGGMPGARYLDEHKGLCDLLLKANEAEKLIGAICAAPMVLGRLGICKGRVVTCYPGFEDKLKGAAEVTKEDGAVTDGHVTTAKGPGTAIDFGLALVEALDGEEQADQIAIDICY